MVNDVGDQFLQVYRYEDEERIFCHPLLSANNFCQHFLSLTGLSTPDSLKFCSDAKYYKKTQTKHVLISSYNENLSSLSFIMILRKFILYLFTMIVGISIYHFWSYDTFFNYD